MKSELVSIGVGTVSTVVYISKCFCSVTLVSNDWEVQSANSCRCSFNGIIVFCSVLFLEQLSKPRNPLEIIMLGQC